MKIAIGCDHAGYPLKLVLIELLKSRSIAYQDFGTDNDKTIVEYPDYGIAVGEAVASGSCDRGVVICGTGIGISIAANKVRGVRCCACSDCYSAKLSREHNNSNVLALGQRVVGTELAKLITEIWLDTPYDPTANGGRHERRVQRLNKM